MSPTPMEVRRRPFSVEPITGVMLPDGIFDTAIAKQRIVCYYTNTSDAVLDDVTIYIEGVSDPGIVLESRTFTFAQIQPGASVMVSWLADFSAATPGKKNVSFVARAAGNDMRRSIKQIFVSKTVFDAATKTFVCAVPEGSIQVRFREVVGPSSREWSDECDERKRSSKGPWIPTAVDMDVVPNPTYTGQFGELPFQDPWWKILGWIVAAIAAIVAIVAAALGHGAAGFGVSGTFDESVPSVSCCSPSPSATEDTTGADTVAGVASVIATGAIAVGLADAKDPWRRGQEATPTGPGEITLSESVKARFEFPAPPQAGTPYAVNVRWTYTRVTNVTTYTHEVTETQTNTHLLHHKTVTAPEKITSIEQPFTIQAMFFRDAEKKRFTGDDLYAWALVLSPGRKMGFYVPLTDDGLYPDEKANEGRYTGKLDLAHAYRRLAKIKAPIAGTWTVFVYAQDVNDATPTMSPVEAATHVGGFMIASATELSFDASLPCPLNVDALVEVIV